MGYRSYVAIGDSFTEGMDDRLPDGSYRGWADMVAAVLDEQAGRDFAYANLAIRGRLYDSVAVEQAPVAVAMKPDLISVAAGGNDVLRRRCDPYDLMARFDQTVGELRATGADVILFRFADVLRHLPGERFVGPRVAVLNQSIVEIAEQRGAILVNLFDDEAYHNPAMWAADRLHLSYAGHRRTAAHVLAALGVPVDTSWFDPLPVLRRSWSAQRASDVQWAAQHLAPWVKRRLLGRSSGDDVAAKRPALTPIDYPI